MLSALEIRALAEEVKALDDEGDDFPVVVPTRPSHPSRRVEPVERTARAVVRRGPVVILGGDRGSGSSVEPGRRPDGIVSGQENSRPETSGGRRHSSSFGFAPDPRSAEALAVQREILGVGEDARVLEDVRYVGFSSSSPSSGGAPTPEENTNTRGTSEPAAAARSTHASRTKGSYGNYNTPQEDGRSNSKPDAGRTTASAKSRIASLTSYDDTPGGPTASFLRGLRAPPRPSRNNTRVGSTPRIAGAKNSLPTSSHINSFDSSALLNDSAVFPTSTMRYKSSRVAPVGEVHLTTNSERQTRTRIDLLRRKASKDIWRGSGADSRNASSISSRRGTKETVTSAGGVQNSTAVRGRLPISDSTSLKQYAVPVSTLGDVRRLKQKEDCSRSSLIKGAMRDLEHIEASLLSGSSTILSAVGAPTAAVYDERGHRVATPAAAPGRRSSKDQVLGGGQKHKEENGTVKKQLLPQDASTTFEDDFSGREASASSSSSYSQGSRPAQTHKSDGQQPQPFCFYSDHGAPRSFAGEVARHDKGQFTSAKPVPQQSLADLKAELEADLEGRPIEERDQMLHSAATQGLSSLDSIVQEIRARGNVATTCSEHSMNMSIGTSATAKSHYRKYAPGEGLGSDCTFTPRLGLTKKKTKEILGTSRANFANVADRLTYMGKSYEKRYEKLVHKHRTSRENAILRAQNAKKTLPKSDHLVHNVGTIGSRASRYMQRRSVSLDKKREELTRKQMRECTFHPQKISKASTSCDGASSSSSDPFYQRLAMHQQRREEKLRNATSVVESMEIEDCSFNPQLAPGSKKLPNVKSKVKEYWEKGSGSQGGAAAHAGGYPSSLSSGMGTAGMGSSSSSAFRDFTESGGCGSLKQYASTLAEQALYTAAANVFSGWQRRGDGDGSCAGLTIAANTQGANQGERNFGAVVPDHSSKGDEKGGRKKILLRRKGSRGKVPEAIPFVDEDVSGDPDLEYVLEQHLSGGAGVMVR
mmetsp:Transcript_25759/g.64952  ORF Transcript_25759/g.64952 Transcript_25759/m.64952 type:complete len:986 (+) Transcript_25759:120-3077(+)|eukprot:CAMPEP_0178988366 /NCGR_PEP_ID=MMETSP0795-20121207/3772_1 /TAXON_ID=88552 /ORGANISM="Amoebophrya sp., Strain Ameob2" /LENGTH=985 /DNA_ID=CAMNT_0020679635 /DNA_START=6 /DNA_END=2963 /DNA_ORIENTATION=-